MLGLGRGCQGGALMVIIPAVMVTSPPDARLEIVLERPGSVTTLYYPTRAQVLPCDAPGREHVWCEIDSPRVSDGALWLWIARSAARTVYGVCPAHVRLVRHQGEKQQVLYDVQL